jgi:hypothetical protein
MVVAGIILLLPGLCAIIFAGMEITSSSIDQTVMSFVVTGLIAGFVGVLLIWNAIRGRRP